MEQKNTKKATAVTTIDDEKDYLKSVMPALAMPNTNPNAVLDEFENLMPKWNEEQVIKLLKNILNHL